MDTLRFNGSLWVNVDIALRSLDHVYAWALDDLELGVIEWYVLRALYQQDGQHASQLARAVGRAATSFTPILDKLEDRGLVERRADKQDRRAVFIHLTDEGKALRRRIQASAEGVEQVVRRVADEAEWEAFQKVLARLVAMNDAAPASGRRQTIALTR
jgi:DNA-binding MarR family transcriptional regulator